MTEAVVHGLEVVEVDEHDAHDRPTAKRATNSMLDAVGEKRPVGKIRDRIVEGLVRELILEGLPLADVAAVEDDAAHVLVLNEIGVLHLELQPRPVAMT